MADTQTVRADELEALTLGTHSAPYHFLGVDRTGKQIELRVFRPYAESIELVLEGRTVPVERIHKDGIFACTLSRDESPARYRFREHRHDGSTVPFYDAHQFEPLLSREQCKLWQEGEDRRAWRWMGAHQRVIDDVTGYHFVVWAPRATRVSVVGAWNRWDGRMHPMRPHAESGLWELFVPEAETGMLYKFEIKSHHPDKLFLKADPFARCAEVRPGTASRLCDDRTYDWQDHAWMENRPQKQRHDRPMSIYEVHAGSWRHPEGGINYGWLKEHLVPYVKEQGFTHVELMPLAEHPYDPSWGYQITGYFAPTSRFGSPDELRALIDAFHEAGIGVIMDWVPGHFTSDAHGLAEFDGASLYEYEDWRLGEHKTWGTKVFDYVRPQVRNFLINNALYWIEEFHIDGLRVDAVASMLYRDYDREDGDWLPNRQGGNEHWEAINFLKECNYEVKKAHPEAWLIAEESTAWGGVTGSTREGGLGFDLKWNMGWMNDTLEFMQTPHPDRLANLNKLTFSMVYAYSERFVLPLSHDEVVHLKQSLLHKMPGFPWQQFANLRLLLTWQYFHPGKPLLFMGAELAQREEWNSDQQLEWFRLDEEPHRGMQGLVQRLNTITGTYKSCYAKDDDPAGFEWLIQSPQELPVLAFVRRSTAYAKPIIAIFNFSDQDVWDMQLGVPKASGYKILLSTDQASYGGKQRYENREGNAVFVEQIPRHGYQQSIKVPLAALSALIITTS
jgi:1,4-alpha-glucan branching enzyme